MRPGRHWRFGWHAWVEDDGRRVLEKRADIGEMAPVEARVELSAAEWADLKTTLLSGDTSKGMPVKIVGGTWLFSRNRSGDLLIRVASEGRSGLVVSTDVPQGDIPVLFALLEPPPVETTLGNVFADFAPPEPVGEMPDASVHEPDA